MPQRNLSTHRFVLVVLALCMAAVFEARLGVTRGTIATGGRATGDLSAVVVVVLAREGAACTRDHQREMKKLDGTIFSRIK